MSADAAASGPPRGGPPWRAGLVLATGLVLILALRAARPLLLPLVFAPFLALLLAAPLRVLRAHGVPEAIGAGVLVAVLAGSAGLAARLLAEPAAQWWYAMPSPWRAVLDAMTRLHLDLLQPESADALRASLAVEGVTLTRLIVGDVLLFSAELAATVVLLYFLLIAQRGLVARIVAALPSRRPRVRLLSFLRRTERDVRHFVVTMTLANLGLAALSAGALALVGLPHALAWGVAIALLSFIPYVGPLLITVLLLLAGSVTFGTTLQALLPPAVFLGLHAIEANLISPWWMGYRLRLSRVAVVVAVLVFGWTWGVAGSFLAVPLLLVMRAACGRERRTALARACFEAEEAPVAEVSALLGRSSRV